MWVLHNMGIKKRSSWVQQIAWPLIDYQLVFSSALALQEEGFTGFMRTLRGRDQEKVIKKKEELWGRACREGDVALHTLSLHCDPWPPARALSALTWETWWPQRKAIFLFPGNHVCNNANRVPTVRPTTWYFVLHGFTDGQERHRQNTVISSFFFLFAQTLWLHKWKATPYTVSMQYYPCSPPHIGGAVWLIDTDEGGRH